MDVKYENGKIVIEVAACTSPQHEIEKCYIKQFSEKSEIKITRDQRGSAWAIELLCEEKGISHD
jgi:hypothetical protein